MITVEGQQRVEFGDFTMRFRDAIKLVPNGAEWLNWAIPISGPSFSANSEAELLENIQTGLHGTPLLSLNDLGLQFVVSLLLEIDDQDYDSLRQAINQGRVTAAAEYTLQREGILTQKDFGTSNEKLEQAGLNDLPLLQTATLGDRLLLHDRVMSIPAGEWPEGEACRQAGKFALAVAQSVREVGAALSFYCFIATKISPGEIDQFAKVWERLSRISFGFLRCPMIPNDSSEELIALLMRQWIGQGSLLGFPTIGDAVVNLARFSSVSLTQDPVDAKPAEQYMLRAQRLLHSAEPVTRLSQDGILRWLDFRTAEADARVILDADACLSLFEFREISGASSSQATN